MLGINILRAVLSRLMASPYYLEVLTVTHSTEGGLNHDVIMQPHMLYGTAMRPGLYSIEIKCYEVQTRSPRSFSWCEKIESEALKGWSKELLANPDVYAARIAVLAEMASPCHSGPFDTHASILWADQTTFTKLWGWSAFGVSPPEPTRPETAPGVAPRFSTPPSRPPDAPSKEEQWRSVVKRLRFNRNGWCPLVDFLALKPQINESKRHPLRFLDGSSKRKSWKSHTGHNPVKGRDWDYLHTDAGGGAGDGILHGHRTFLKHIFLKYYAK